MTSGFSVVATPYGGAGGLDVEVQAGGTTWHLDIVLVDEHGNLHIGEAKRWRSNVPQSEVRRFAGTLDDVRRTTGKQVTGIFFAKKDAQASALGVAKFHEVLVVISGENQPLPAFGVTLVYTDPNANGRGRRESHEHVVMTMASVSTVSM